MDDPAFEDRMADCYSDLLRLALLLVGRRAEAEDVVQAALERAWRARQQLHDPQRLEPWLRRIVAREASRSRASTWSRLRAAGRDVVDLSVPQTPGLAPDLAVDLNRAFEHLPPVQRVAVVLHHYAGYTVDEVAELLDVPRETVRSRLRLAMARLRRELDA
ncbi:MAG TPA: RNA polymerase sigma factor [Candidatus Limnocylindrales bacterium]|nr:RNA polymerase sigma factor [Candidatus Limnocylindrales bacterium]